MAWLADVGAPVVMSNWLWWHGQSIMPLATLLTVQPMWVHTALNALNWPADGCVTTNSPDALMTPPPTGTSAVFTGVPLGAAADAEPVADALVAEEDVEDPDEVVDADVVVEGAVVVGVVEPPHAARAAAPATPAPPTPAARRTVRRFMAVSPPVASLDVLLVVVSGCADMASSCL